MSGPMDGRRLVAPVPPPADSSNHLATTAWVHSVIGAAGGGGGTVTSVGSGTGLTGGPITTAGALALAVPVVVANGGTGATTAAGALTSLGAAPLASPAFTGIPTAPTAPAGDNSTRLATTAFVTPAVNARTRWVRYSGPPQSFLANDLTRDGDWTMVANANTSDRPAPQPSGPEEDLLPAWTPTNPNARATYTLYNEWTLNQSGWISQYGADILGQNLGANHVITLQVNGVNRDTFTAIPSTAQLYLHDVTPILVLSGAVLRVTLQVTQVGNNQMFWLQQTGLFATPPNNCSLAVGSKDGAAAGTTAYGCHLTFTPGASSPNWDVVAFGGSAGSGGGGGTVTSVGSGTGLTGGPITTAGALALVVPVVVANGGTGATTAAGALTSLGAAPLASPALTGTPSAPTPAPADSSTTIATTAFVKAQAYAPLASPTFTGTPAAPTATAGTNTTQLATTAFVATSFAPLASPALTGTPSAPTAAFNTSTTQLATTAYVKTGVNDASPAPAGQIGEYASVILASTSAVPVATATVTNITQLTLAAGDWEVWGEIGMTGLSSMSPPATILIGGISNATATMPLVGDSASRLAYAPPPAGGPGNAVFPLAPCRQNVSVPTTIYLVVSITYSNGAASGFGKIAARRAR